MGAPISRAACAASSTVAHARFHLALAVGILHLAREGHCPVQGEGSGSVATTLCGGRF